MENGKNARTTITANLFFDELKSAFSVNNITVLSLQPEFNELTKNLCLHHLYLTYECIYRVWVKATHILHYLHSLNVKKNSR